VPAGVLDEFLGAMVAVQDIGRAGQVYRLQYLQSVLPDGHRHQIEGSAGPAGYTQREDQADAFANKLEYVHYDAKEKKVYLSPILNWYGGDFGGPTGVIDFLLSRVESSEIHIGLKVAREDPEKIVYNEI